MAGPTPKAPPTLQEVMTLQTALNQYAAHVGFRLLVVDGIPGTRTREAYTLTLWWLDRFHAQVIAQIYGWASSAQYPEWYSNFQEIQCYGQTAQAAKILDTLRDRLVQDGKWQWQWQSLWWSSWSLRQERTAALQRQRTIACPTRAALGAPGETMDNRKLWWLAGGLAVVGAVTAAVLYTKKHRKRSGLAAPEDQNLDEEDDERYLRALEKRDRAVEELGPPCGCDDQDRWESCAACRLRHEHRRKREGLGMFGVYDKLARRLDDEAGMEAYREEERQREYEEASVREENERWAKEESAEDKAERKARRAKYLALHHPD
jgi:hypothetical protein